MSKELSAIIKREYTRAIDRKRMRDCYDAPADAILAAGYSKPRTITTIGDLSGERAGTIILTAHGRVFEYTSRNWLCPGFQIDYQPIIDWLPATIIYSPEES